MTRRDACPACAAAPARPVALLRFGAPPLSDYLRAFYADHPGCDFSTLAGKDLAIAECPRCGCIFQATVPDDAFLARFYRDGLYGGLAPERAVEPYVFELMAREMAMVVRFLQPRVARPAVLDFGTGEGQWARLAASTGLATHACDVSDHAFARLAAAGITCHRTSELPHAAFDFINTEQVFEHLPRPADEVVRLAAALRPGGVLKIGVPHDPLLRKKLGSPDWLAPKNSPASLNGIAPVEHLNHFSPEALRHLAARAGLEALAVRGWELLPGATRRPGLRSQVALRVRTRLRDVYRPAYPLTQTAFFVRAA